MASPEAGSDQEGVLGEFRFRSGCLVVIMVVFGAQALGYVLLAASLRRQAVPGEYWLLPCAGWFAVGLAALASLPVVLYLFVWANALLRISEDGLSYQGALGGRTSVTWDQIVSLHTGSAKWETWSLRYRRGADGKMCRLSLPPLVFTPINTGAALHMVRTKACLTRDVRSFWKWSLWGRGWERE